MEINRLAHVGEAVELHAKFSPSKIGGRDSVRSISYARWNDRACRLANGLLGLGLAKGDRVAILAYNCVEWLEIYVALAKAGLVAVPVNFRLVGPEIAYIVGDCGAQAMIVQDDLRQPLEGVRAQLGIPESRYVLFGNPSPQPGYRQYEEILSMGRAGEPPVDVQPEDPWAFMYTSGTTGKPKGAIRSHDNSARLAIITALDQGFGPDDTGLLVMPLCHSNSFWYATLLAYCGATTVVYDQRHFDPESLLQTLHREKATFTSLVPTHYIMLLGLPEATKQKHRGDDAPPAKARSWSGAATGSAATSDRTSFASSATARCPGPRRARSSTGSCGSGSERSSRRLRLHPHGGCAAGGTSPRVPGEVYACHPPRERATRRAGWRMALAKLAEPVEGGRPTHVRT